MNVKIFVDFIPNAQLTNEIIKGLNKSVPTMSGQAFATNLASQIAAIAFVLHSNNPHEMVKDIFNGIIDDAGHKFEARRKAFAQANKEVDDDERAKPN